MSDITVIKAYADWCGPCRIYGKAFHYVRSQKEGDGLTFQEINVDHNPQWAREHNVHVLPTTIVLDGENEISRIEGALASSMLLSFLESAGVS